MGWVKKAAGKKLEDFKKYLKQGYTDISQSGVEDKAITDEIVSALAKCESYKKIVGVLYSYDYDSEDLENYLEGYFSGEE